MKRQERRAIKLGDVCEKPQYGYTASAQREEVGPKFLRITDLREGTIDWDTVPCCKVDKTGAQRYGLHHGDVLVARIGATTGSTSIVVNPPPSVFASYLIRLRPTREMHPFFLYFYTKSEQFHQWIDAHKDSNLKGGVNVPTLLSAPLTLPVLAEQQKIAAVLWKMQRAVAIQDRLIAATRDLKQSAMQRLFTHGLRGEPLKDTAIGSMPKSWKVVALGDFGRIGNGSTPKKTMPEYWRNPTTPWLTSAKVHDGIIRSADQFVSDAAVRECHLPLVPAGSLLVAITGQGKTLGNAALVEFDTTISQHMAYVRFDHDSVVPGYVYQFMRSRYEELQGIGRAGGSTKAALTCAFLRDYRLPLPSPDEQRDIATALATIDRKLAHHQKKRAALNDLFQTTLHQLMTAQIRVANLDIDASEVADHSVDTNKMIGAKNLVARRNQVADVSKIVKPAKSKPAGKDA